MFRVVTRHIDREGHMINENGPWLESATDANHWADIFRSLGYCVTVESMHGKVSGSSIGRDDDFRDALSSMA